MHQESRWLSRVLRASACFLAAGLLVDVAEAQEEFRGFWADVFHQGFKSTSEVDAMIARALEGNYNAILPEVLAYHDTQYASHGAYWQSNIVPQSSVVSGGFDPLGYMVQQAHANGLEVHPWLVAYRVSTTWPPPGNSYLAARPEWLMVPQANMGTVAKVGSSYTFDPGSPDVQEYLTSIVRELVTDYEIDGIHWDYIRYTQTDAGYPTDTGYAQSSLARFKQITGYSGTPSPSYDPWEDFRRRTITELVRRVRAEIPTITSNPRQPVRYTAALVTWYPASTNFHQTRPYYQTFCDWEYWAYMGYLDATIPMTYFDENSYPITYRAWVDNSVTWAYQRQTFIGPGIYMNVFADSLTQMQYVRGAGAHGFCTYSYGTTNDGGATWSDWYPYIASNLFTQPVPTPSMPWRDPATATEGTLYGQVTDWSTGNPVDDATVQVGALAPVQTDGAGYYVVTLIPATAGGTSYQVTASKTGLPSEIHSGVVVLAGDVVRDDLGLGSPLPQIELDVSSIDHAVYVGNNLPNDTFTVRNSGGGTLNYSITDDDAGWLSQVPGAGTSTGEADTITVVYDTAGLGQGAHIATIEVADPNATNSPQTIVVTVTVMIPGDFDLDGDVDLDDYAHLQECLTGASVPQDDPDCQDAKLDGDSQVDQNDANIFLGCLSGANVPADPGCTGG